MKDVLGEMNMDERGEEVGMGKVRVKEMIEGVVGGEREGGDEVGGGVVKKDVVKVEDVKGGIYGGDFGVEVMK
ncbi:hypothetical protein [Cytobacillus oceanisediminis]|uniref:hypothetical protein n=1 Tax=Cytobacillus oceanisediminis TaxID=665099 RepID=UPI00119DBA40|nr:hypothetical protein [Cytobacillus oceanisediminis]